MKIKTHIGDLELTGLQKNSLGYHAITGKGFDQKTWMVSKQEYDRLKKGMRL